MKIIVDQILADADREAFDRRKLHLDRILEARQFCETVAKQVRLILEMAVADVDGIMNDVQGMPALPHTTRDGSASCDYKYSVKGARLEIELTGSLTVTADAQHQYSFSPVHVVVVRLDKEAQAEFDFDLKPHENGAIQSSPADLQESLGEAMKQLGSAY